MKKQILATLVTTAVGSAALAGSLSMDARADYEAQTTNDAANAAGSYKYNKFNLNTLRVDGKGSFNETTSYRLRFRLNKGASAGTTNSRDSVNDAVDFANITHKLTDSFSLQLGKFGTDIGGFEGMTAGPDLYFTSQGYGEGSALRYATGLKAMYAFADQTIDVMVSNEQVDATGTGTSAGFNQTRNAAGIVYKGSFMDKMLSPVLSFHQDNLQPTATTGIGAVDKKYTYTTAGLKYDMAPFFVEADYSMNNLTSKSVLDQTDKTTSLVATVGMKMDNVVGKLKVESSETETFSTATASSKVKYAGYQLAAEYMPSNDKNFRYHAALISRDTKPETGDTRTTQTAIVGVRILADFMK